MTSPPDAELHELLGLLRAQRGYVPPAAQHARLAGLQRARMAALDLEDGSDYRRRLIDQPEELDRLLEACLAEEHGLLDPDELWQHLHDDVLPQLLGRLDGAAPVRVWCAGCATGEEAYTLAVLLVAVLGPEAFRERVRLYATDPRETALGRARRGVFGAGELARLRPEWIAPCFEPHGEEFVFRADLRRCLVFGQHDLVSDAPISRLDLIVCRDVLLWMDPDRRWQAVARLGFALNDGGLLALGADEELQSHRELLVAQGSGRRLFAKVAGKSPALPLALGLGGRAVGGVKGRALLAAALQTSPLALLVVRPDGALVLASRRAQDLFGLLPVDLGRRLSDLAVARRPLPLAPLLEQAVSLRAEVVRTGVPHVLPDGSHALFDVHVTPLGPPDDALGACISFVDRTVEQRLKRTARPRPAAGRADDAPG